MAANKYKKQLDKLYIDTWYDEKYKFYHATCWCDKYKIEDSNLNEHQFVSLNKEFQILGLIGYHINRSNDYVDDLWIINFSDNKIIFGLDVRKAIDEIFTKYNFRKLTFSVVVGNSIETQYDKLIHKFGGRVVGTYKESVKLMDNKYYDEKFYEIFRSDYLAHARPMKDIENKI